MKTLVVIINHNLPKYTNFLYQELIRYQTDEYDTLVFDNGSSDEGKPETFHLATEENCFFGGAINLMFSYMLEHEEYDSLLFMNNDLLINGSHFVEILRREMFEKDYTILSPSIFQVRFEPELWKQMLNYGTQNVRDVPWVDFISPLIHRRLIEEIKQFDMELIYGWGIDIYCGIVSKYKEWKIGVVDYISIVHLVATTTKEGKSNITFEEYCGLAQKGMDLFFLKIGLKEEQQIMMELAQKYEIIYEHDI